MPKSTVFKSNRSQAVRLPKSVAFPEGVREVDVIKVGEARIITPAGKSWDEYFDRAPTVSPDFMNERIQPPAEEREPF